MNKTVGIVLVIIVILGGLYLATRAGNNGEVVSEDTNNVSGEGRVVVSVTDAAVNMQNVSEVNMRISRVDIHSQGAGWVTLSTTPRTYDLLELNASGESKLLVDAGASSGTYDQVRLVIDQVNVVTASGSTRAATLPSNEFALSTKLVVREDSTSSVNLDFLADKSLHITGDGEYVFAPVVKTETRSGAGISVDTNSTVTIGGGTVDNSSTSGMDIDGSVKLNFQLATDQRLDVQGESIIKLDALLK